MRLQVSEQLRLRGERLRADRAREVGDAVLLAVGVSLFGRLKHLVAPAAGEAVLVQVRLLVIGQAGQVVEVPVALGALVDGARAVGALVGQQLRLGPEHGVALEAGVGAGGAGLQGAGLLLLTLQVGYPRRRQRRAARPVGPQMADHLETGTHQLIGHDGLINP